MARLKILCLHGSRQDAEIFSQRVSKLTKRLADIADFTFVDAPHELPLEEGQEVRMRSWWTTSLSPASGRINPHQVSSGESMESAEAWLEDNIVSEWKESLLKLEWTWTCNGGFDGILGFSKGAAAAFLLAAHCIGNPRHFSGLKFVIVAGGYVPQPLARLLPPSLVNSAKKGKGILSSPLPLQSLHIMGQEDAIVTVTASEELVKMFSEHARQVIVHEKNHIWPQQAEYIQAVRDFMLRGAGPSMTVAKSVQMDGVLKVTPEQPLLDDPGGAAAQGVGPLAERQSGLSSPPELVPIEEPVAAAEMPEEQQEELLSLEAIFMEEYSLISSAPPKFAISLKEPGMEHEPDGPPSGLFSVIFTLPPGYPQTEVPIVHVVGPLGVSDPRRLQLQDVLMQIAQENLESACSSVFQIAEAAKEWIDTHLPANIQDEKPGGEAAAAAASLSLGTEGASTTGTPWWENEEADADMVRHSIQEASKDAWWWRSPSAQTFESATHSERSDEFELAQRGRWDYVVGLVGKPSAGKSTFFNAVTDPARDEDGAKVGSFPFTTIEPNVGRGFILLPDPAKMLQLDPKQFHTSFGHAMAFNLENINDRYSNVDCLKAWAASTGWGSEVTWRRLPVTVKDVAGLVPGAYKGRGHGNAFLADLCDADVLVHVVDISGSTDRQGGVVQAGEGADPLDDIGWVREELHRWVYDKVRTKWSTVVKKPSRLPSLFSGYRASRALVESTLQRIGIAPGSLDVEGASLAHWGEADLHRLVANFLQIRFPILLALNKADLGTAEAHLLRVRQRLPHEPMVAVSAACERWLCQQRRMGAIAYQDGAIAAQPLREFMDLSMGPRLDSIHRNVLARFGGTGTAAAISAAVALRPPRVSYPVADLETYAAIPAPAHVSGGGLLGAGADAKARALDTGVPRLLRDAVLMKPGSTIEDLYRVLSKPPYQLLEGEYVRAECRLLRGPHSSLAPTGRSELPGAKSKVLKKDDLVEWENCVLRIATNRRANWQHKYG